MEPNDSVCVHLQPPGRHTDFRGIYYRRQENARMGTLSYLRLHLLALPLWWVDCGLNVDRVSRLRKDCWVQLLPPLLSLHPFVGSHAVDCVFHLKALYEHLFYCAVSEDGFIHNPHASDHCCIRVYHELGDWTKSVFKPTGRLTR